MNYYPFTWEAGYTGDKGSGYRFRDCVVKFNFIVTTPWSLNEKFIIPQDDWFYVNPFIPRKINN